ncbi:MAG: hypothetical protein ACYDHP_14200 [Ferrimicrobium sp.]
MAGPAVGLDAGVFHRLGLVVTVELLFNVVAGQRCEHLHHFPMVRRTRGFLHFCQYFEPINRRVLLKLGRSMSWNDALVLGIIWLFTLWVLRSI